MPLWFVRAKSQCDDCVVLGFLSVPGVCEKWSTHTARFQKNNQTAPELCKQEPQKGWKKYLNEASNKHLWSGPDSMSSNLSDGFRRWSVAKLAGGTVAFSRWLSYCSGELRESMCNLLVAFLNYVCVNYHERNHICWQIPGCHSERFLTRPSLFWYSECVHNTCIQLQELVCECYARLANATYQTHNKA